MSTNRTSAARSREATTARRRDAIFVALHDCIIERGYARTSLADIARAAGMSPSHVLYYFHGKEAILVQYFGHMAGRIVTRLESFRSEPVERRIQLLTALFFGGKGISKSEIGFMLECFGVAVHEPDLQRQKAELDRFCKAYLRELFEESPCGPARAVDAAEVAYAMLVGLRTAAYFDERLSSQQALAIFRDQMVGLAGLAGAASATPAGRRRAGNGAARRNGRPKSATV